MYGRRAAASAPSQPTFTSSNTWTSERQDISESANDSHRWSCFRTIPGGNVTESLGINFATDPDRVTYWAIVEITAGYNAADPIGATNWGAGTQFSGTMDVGTLADSESIVLMQSWKAGTFNINLSGGVLLDETFTASGSGNSNAVSHSRVPGVDSIGYAYGGAGGTQHQLVEVKAS